ncbi:Ger(x)C family spore germination protein [Clostridium sp. 'White wine YQ']|uniref:Ger(x)C family spore germination protein n=1 Tax=Clostridium sp. 'White wine YQ' TaxID=3027474 RepID=UPI002366272F|nr:Ger(x)C family spore germination protein [Clostridium sp. 'White wine YQ']MDD7795883.1 Ger(x)C family spore germination protein [Clostridium sp. 'White wine YQ']
MRILKFLFISIFLTQILLSSSGCSSTKEIDKRAFTACIGIDKGEQDMYRFKITLTLALPEKQTVDYLNLTAEANTLDEAIDVLKTESSKDIDFSYAQIIMLGKDLASEDLAVAMDWLIRIKEIQKISYLVIGEPSAKIVLDKRAQLQKKAGKNLLSMNSLILAFDGTGVESNYITQVYLFDFYRSITELGVTPFLPIIKVQQDHFKINQLALLEKDKSLKIKTIFSPDETKIFNMIYNNKNHLRLDINTPERNFVINVQNVKYNYYIDSTNKSHPKLQYNVKITGIIAESTTTQLPIDLNSCEELSSEVLRKQILKMLKKIQSENLDPIGFGLRYRSRNWNNSTKFEDWNKLYPSIDYEVNLKMKLESSGLVR